MVLRSITCKVIDSGTSSDHDGGMSDSVPAYAVAYLVNVKFGDEVVRYMREIDDTLSPFGGEFLIHGGETSVREGNWGDGALVVIRFPNMDAASRWYDSDNYQRILALRVNNSDSTTALVQGVAPGHTGAKRVEELLARGGQRHPSRLPAA